MDSINFEWLPQIWSGYIDPFITIVTFSITIWTVALVIRTWRRIKQTNIKIKTSSSSGEPVVVDFHGDFDPEASQEKWASGWEVVQFPLQGIELNTSEGLEGDLFERLEAFKRQYPELFGRLQAYDSNIVLTITGSSSVFGAWLPMLHGIVGQFPKITYPSRQQGGSFVWPKPIDCQRIRLLSSEKHRTIKEFGQSAEPDQEEKA